MDKRYLIVVGAVLVQAVTIGCVFSYGVFFTVLEAEFGWSRTLLSAASAIAFFNMGFFAIVAGQLSDKFGPRGVLLFTALCTSCAYILMYFLSAPWQLLLIYSIFVALGLGSHDVVTLSTIARWFPRRRGVMSGIVKVGTALGQMSVPVIAVALIAAVGWRSAFLLQGIGAAAILLTGAWLIGLKPSESKNSVGKKPGENKSDGLGGVPASPQGISLSEAKKDSAIWVLCAMQFFFFGSVITIPTHIVPHGIDSGLSPAQAASILSVIAAFSIAGRLFIGRFVDKIGGKRAYNFCLALLFVSIVSLLFIESGKLLFAFGALYGMAHGGMFTVVSPTVAEYFGMRSHGAIFGVIVFTGTVGGSLLPIITGLIFDKLGSYQWAFVLLSTMVFISFVLSLRLAPMNTPRLEY